MNDLTKNILLWVVIAVVLLTVFSSFMPAAGAAAGGPVFDRSSTEVQDGRVDSVVFEGETIHGERKDKSSTFKTYNPETDNTALIGDARARPTCSIEAQRAASSRAS